MFPLPLNVTGITTDSMSFENINLLCDVEIPVGLHVGAFGAERKFDTHKGVDLYAPADTPVYAIEDGVVVNIAVFTGASIGMPWWNETKVVKVEGESGVLVYGEIKPIGGIKLNDEINEGDQLGIVLTVLQNDKGRPMSMLHFARHRHNVIGNGRWLVGDPQPSGLLDPTNLLIREWQKDA